MPKYSTLRSFMRRFKSINIGHVLANCCLVVEGDSFFRQSYKDSGCNFILGGEYDRYADYLRTILTSFIESNVTCYVVFNGTMNVDIEERKAIHKKIIEDRANILPGDDKYYDPIFMKDVHKQVLDELGIRYCVTEYDARETLLDASKQLGCPVLTNHIEQCLLGITCIVPSSLIYDSTKKQITCKIQTPEGYGPHFRLFDNMKPIFLTVVDESGPLYKKIPEIIGSNPNNPVGPFLYWIRRQKREMAIDKLVHMLNTEAEQKAFRGSVDVLRKLIFYNRKPSATLSYLTAEQIVVNDWFKKGVMTGEIAGPYVNLRNNGFFSGSWVAYDETRRDAIRPAIEIAMCAYNLLGDIQINVTFIGRFGTLVSDECIAKGPHQWQLGKNTSSQDLFKKFVDAAVPGFDWLLLKRAPEDCRVLLIALTYYMCKAERNFILAAQSILLSYIMLGHVSEKVGLIKKSKIVSHCGDSEQEDNSICIYKDCLDAARAMMDYFYEGNIKETFDRIVLHDLAEFQHCLQHMNYLNKLCGEKIRCTNYSKTYNGTFIFNVLISLNKLDNPMAFFESHSKASSSVVTLYNSLKELFDSLLSTTLSNKKQKRNGIDF